jgi:hypothetical protein
MNQVTASQHNVSLALLREVIPWLQEHRMDWVKEVNTDRDRLNKGSSSE